MSTLYERLLDSFNVWQWAALILIPFVVTILIVPWIVVQLPADYFQQETRKPVWWGIKHPLIRMMLNIGKNLVALVLVLVGILMLVLPGQGLLTIMTGVLILDFPRKYQCERWLVSKKPVRRSINWLRQKWNKPPIVL